MHVAVVLLAALLLVGCGTADEEASSEQRRNDPGLIVFCGLSGSNGGSYAIRPDGTGLRSLRSDADDLALSADGRSIATSVTSFNAIACGETTFATCTTGLFVAALEGGPAHRVGPTLFEPTLVAWTTAELAGA